MLSKYAGKVFIHKGLGELASGSELFETLAENALRWMKESGKSTINARDLKDIKEPMIFYQRHLVDGVYQVSTILALPPSEINRLQSSGDMSGNLITLDAGRNQTHLNNRLVASAALNVIAKGALERITEKYTIFSQMGHTRISQEYAMPQQAFICTNGPVKTITEGKTEEQGTLTIGKGIEKKSAQDSIIEETLVLERKETKTKEKKKALGRSKKETKETVTHSHVQTVTTATDGSITKDGKKTIEQSGSKNVATEAITYKGGELKSSSLISIDSISNRKKKKGICSKTEKQSRQESISAAISQDHAPTLNVETVKASMEGVDVKGETMNASVGGTYAPKIAEVKYHQGVKSKQPLMKSDCGVKGGQEVEIRTKLDVKKINRLPSKTESDSGEKLSPLKFVNVDWDKENTQVNGEIEESFRELKSWQKK